MIRPRLGQIRGAWNATVSRVEMSELQQQSKPWRNPSNRHPVLILMDLLLICLSTPKIPKTTWALFSLGCFILYQRVFGCFFLSSPVRWPPQCWRPGWLKLCLMGQCLSYVECLWNNWLVDDRQEYANWASEVSHPVCPHCCQYPCYPLTCSLRLVTAYLKFIWQACYVQESACSSWTLNCLLQHPLPFQPLIVIDPWLLRTSWVEAKRSSSWICAKGAKSCTCGFYRGQGKTRKTKWKIWTTCEVPCGEVYAECYAPMWSQFISHMICAVHLFHVCGLNCMRTKVNHTFPRSAPIKLVYRLDFNAFYGQLVLAASLRWEHLRCGIGMLCLVLTWDSPSFRNHAVMVALWPWSMGQMCQGMSVDIQRLASWGLMSFRP